MFNETDRVFVSTPKSIFYGESCVVQEVVPAGSRDDYGKDIYDYVKVEFVDGTIRWYDETVLNQNRRSGEPNFDSHVERRKPTIFNRLLGRV